VGDHVFLKVKANISSLKLGNCSKLEARYCGLFEMLERIGLVAYMFALPTSMIIHNVFHVSLLNKYILDANHVIDWNVIRVEQGSTFQVHLVCILDRKIMRMQLGRMKMLCGRNTQIFLKILEILLILCK
jgi:hypothetical protein